MRSKTRLQGFLATVFATYLATLWTGSPAIAATSDAHALIQGSGSSWAANAVNQWIADVHSNGLQVVFTSSGSAQGRKDFANNTVDFAVSDIGFQGVDPATGQDDTSQGREYAYVPIVAGGTALPYQIRVGGQLVRNLRLSGETIAKIFTQQITNWDDKEITADNNGHALPNLPIIPVVHSEGSGSSYQFTRYLATEYSSIWKPFAGLGATEYFPPPRGSEIAENGSDGVMNFISSGAANGAIGYDEYSYALGKDYPVAKVLNTGGYYTLPNQYNVAVALTKAEINTDKSSPDYLLQNLDHVYTYNDRRVYPISSYSYGVIPTSGTDSKMTTAKRQTLADYLQYSVCQGQAEMGRIGYSPLPINLVQASFDQVTKLHDADSGVDVTRLQVSACHNPTFIAGHPAENYLAQVAPQPEACDKQGAGPCTDNGNTGQVNPPGTPGGGDPSGSNPSGSNPSGNNPSGKNNGHGNNPGANNPTGNNGNGNNPGANNGNGTPTTGSSSTAGTTTQIDPKTGQLVTVQNGGGSDTGGGITNVGQAVPLSNSQSPGTNLTLALLAGGLLIGVLVVPPLIAGRTSKKNDQER